MKSLQQAFHQSPLNPFKLFTSVSPNHPSRNLTSARQLSVIILQRNTNDPLAAFLKMQSSGLSSDYYDYSNAFSACATSKRLGLGLQIFSLVVKNGFFYNDRVFTGLIHMFAMCTQFANSLRVFKSNIGSNVVCWNAVIAGGVRNGENTVALDLFRTMVSKFCMPSGSTFSSVLRACSGSREWEMGRAVHAWVIKCDVKDDIFIGSCIVDLYTKSGDMDEAMKEFSRMPVRNVVSWTAMISGFSQNGNVVDAIHFFREMVRRSVEVDKYTLTSVLLACSKCSMVKETLQIHCWTLKNGLLFVDSVVENALISTYSKIREIWLSKKVFEEMGLQKSLGTWWAMIAGLAYNERLKELVEIFKGMFHEGLKPDNKCTTSLLSAVDNVDLGKQVHCYAVKIGILQDVLLGSALFIMYSKCGSISDSYDFFTQMNERDRVSWTSMVSGLAVHGCASEALKLFRGMVLEGIQPDETALCAASMACCDSQFLMQGKEIHGHALRGGTGSETVVSSALVSMYSNCKALVSSKRTFDAIRCKDQMLWSSLLTGYSANGCNKEVLAEFQRMVVSGFQLDHIISSAVLRACTDLSKPILGAQLHAQGIKGGMIFDISLSTMLLTMYSKCGSINDSWKVFEEIEHLDLITWTSMIDGYAQHGMGLDALVTFEKMKNNGVRPDSVTFLSVLSACNHSGLVEEGFGHFDSMRRDFGIEPERHHYTCMIDVLGRSGRLKEAVNFIESMPLEPDWIAWSTLLASCRVYGDVELGNSIAKKVVELKPRDSGAYISASLTSAEQGDWKAVVGLRSAMDAVGMNKIPAFSFV